MIWDQDLLRSLTSQISLSTKLFCISHQKTQNQILYISILKYLIINCQNISFVPPKPQKVQGVSQYEISGDRVQTVHLIHTQTLRPTYLWPMGIYFILCFSTYILHLLYTKINEKKQELVLSHLKVSFSLSRCMSIYNIRPTLTVISN